MRRLPFTGISIPAGMKQSSSILIAVASVLSLTAAGRAATRPHYGGTLHIALREMPQALDPATLASSPARNLSRLVFETLVSINPQGRQEPVQLKRAVGH